MRLDVVIPAHNEARRIDKTLHAYRSTVDDPMARFIVALDRCTDETAAVVQGHARVDGRVEVVQYPKLGKGGVLMESFRQCQAEVVGFVDADCATPPAEFLRLVDTVAGERGDGDLPVADVAIANRFHPSSVLPARRSMGRRITSRGFSVLVQVLFGLPCADTQCGAKVMRKRVLVDALPLLSSRDFLFDVDLLVVADRLGFRIVEVPTVWLDRDGSHVHPVADGRRMAASALALWLHHRVIPLPDATSPRVPLPEGVPDPERPPQRSKPGAAHRSVVPRHAPDVAMVTPFPDGSGDAPVASGVTSYAARLTAALAAEGVTVEVIAPRSAGVVPRVRTGNVTVSRAYRLGPWALPAALGAAARTGAPVVHVQHETFLYGGPSSVPGLVPGLARVRHAGAASVVTLHQVVDPSVVDGGFVAMHRVHAPVAVVRAGLGAIRSAVETLADRTIVHEEALARLVPSAAVVPLGVEQCAVLPRSLARQRLGLRQDRLVALCFGFLSPYKGLESALEAAEIAGDAVELVVAGGEHPRLVGRDRYAASLRARFGGAARFTGYVADADVAWWFSAADVVLVLYPRPFAASGAFAEALAYGRAVLCSEAFARCVGAPPETVVPIDPCGLASRLLELAARPSALDRIATASARVGRERTWARTAAAHARIYGEVIDANRAAGRGLRAREPR